MKIRFISDIHAELNMTYSPTEFVDIMHTKKDADVTLIAGDLNTNIEEAKSFLNTYFKDEKVIFIGGNHTLCGYDVNNNATVQEIINDHKKEFNGQWKFLENDYIWLSNDIAVIGCVGWTDYRYHDYKEYHSMVDEQGRRLDQDGNLLPIDPRDTPEFKEKVKAIWNDEKKDYDTLNEKFRRLYASVAPKTNERVDTTFKKRVSKEVYNNYMNWLNSLNKQGKYEFSLKDYIRTNKRVAEEGMNDFRFGKMPSKTLIFGKPFRFLRPDDCLKFHRQSKRIIKKCYNEIVAKNPNATIILMTHHPFTTKCASIKHKGEPLNAAFISNCNSWLKKFKQIKYYCCGHVHNRAFKKLGDIEIVCNPMGYLYYNEHKYDIPFNINYILDVN